MAFIVFGARESEVLLDRLEAGGCIADALEADYAEWPRATIEGMAADIADRLRAARPVDASTPVAVAILADALEGATLFARLDDAVACREMTPARAAALRRAAQSAARKLEAHTGRRVRLPAEAT